MAATLAAPRARWRAVALIAAVAVGMLVSSGSAAAAKGPGPTILETTVKPAGPTTATVDVLMNPQRVRTLYAIELVWQTSSNLNYNVFAEHVIGGVQVTNGEIPAGSGPVTVSATFDELSTGIVYFYRVYAYNSVASETGEGTSYSFGFGRADPWTEGTEPYLPEESRRPLYFILLDEAESARTIREYEQHELAVQREEEQARQHRLAELAAVQQFNEEAAARYAKEHAAGTPRCVAPALRGDSLHNAKRALTKAGCALGHVRWLHRSGPVVVLQQSLARGQSRPLGAAIAVTVGRAPHRR